MSRLVLLFVISLFALDALAHVSQGSPFQHGLEHLLLALVLVPVAWLLLPQLLRRLKALFRR
jgi:Na+/pantothenate symporter